MTNYSIIRKSELEDVNRLDAEYFQPEYIKLEKTLIASSSHTRWGELDGKFITGPFGSEFDTENYIDKGQYRYVRGKDVKEFFLADNDNVYIPEEEYNRLVKYSLKEGDILVSVVGTNGNTAIISPNTLPAIFSCKSTVFRSSNIDTYYFIAFLNSKYGKGLLLRSVRGQVQTGLNIQDLKELEIYTPAVLVQKIIGDPVRRALQEIESSKQLYKDAEDFLLEELGLKDFQIPENLSYVVNYSDAGKVARIDADYFQPKHKRLTEEIKSKNAKPLGELVSLKKGFEPGSESYQGEGKLFIRVSCLSRFGIENGDQKYLDEELYQKLRSEFEPRVREILLTKDATPGVAYVLKEPIEGIISGGILRLKTKVEVDPEYLALCINSIVGQWQAERDAGGSIIAHWRPEQIKDLLIPILPLETQQKIADLVRQSHETRKKSKDHLEEAKRKVEEMIEKGPGK